PRFRYLAVVLLDQDAAGLDDILRLAVVQPDGLDVLTQALDAQGMNRLRGVGHGKQSVGGLVYADVGGLGREDHGNQQFERVAVVQFGDRLGIVLPGPAKDFMALGFVHCQLMVPVTRTRLLPMAAGAGSWAAWRALMWLSMTFFRAISRPMNRKAPGGRMTNSTSL